MLGPDHARARDAKRDIAALEARLLQMQSPEDRFGAAKKRFETLEAHVTKARNILEERRTLLFKAVEDFYTLEAVEMN